MKETGPIPKIPMLFKKPLSWKIRLGLALVPTLAILAAFLGKLLRGECAVPY